MLAKIDRSSQRHGCLGQEIRIGDPSRPRDCLLVALDYGRLYRAFEDRGRRGKDQAAGIAADSVARLIYLPRQQRRPIDLRHAPMRVTDGEAAQDAIGQIRGRVIDVVDPTIAADQIALLQVAALVLDRAARNVEGRTRLRNDRPGRTCRQRDRPADCHPFADRMRRRGEPARDLKQPARRIIAVGCIAAGAGRYEDEIGGVNKYGVVEQRAGIAIVRIVAQLVALDVDRNLIGRLFQLRMAWAAVCWMSTLV